MELRNLFHAHGINHSTHSGACYFAINPPLE
jgi:hypothetical protein